MRANLARFSFSACLALAILTGCASSESLPSNPPRRPTLRHPQSSSPLAFRPARRRPFYRKSPQPINLVKPGVRLCLGLPTRPLPTHPNLSATESEAVEHARQDLARRLGVPETEIILSTVIPQEFTAWSFACQAMKDRLTRDVTPETINGLTIILIAGILRFEYHADERSVLFCRPLR